MATLPASTGSRWVKWIGAFALGGAILAVLIAVTSLTLARYDMIDKLSGFIGFMMLLNPARALAVIAAIGLLLAFVRKTGPKWQSATALVLSGGLLVVIYYAVILPAGEAPPLHDITTDVDDPPQFQTLELRADNLIPFQSEEEWRAAHRTGYPDIGPVVIDKSPSEVLANARALAEGNGWDIASIDIPAGHMEATAYAGYLRFRDDVIVEVTPIDDGSTRVDMRSVSRVGLSDLGYNAKRIEAFLAELQTL
ncbi:DUF1499 domain-containing protein [Alteraurantiacibacter aestuarii]|uniref:DUF1499 domain-containing protein n=1 Tax=Alteraurantiacibacter aestuarii TaxID=650004 RepID=A0A844ZJG9_9SPHN|nr:DUF1499 domain-containing protein [Alteraurantiacibacter aestuarii]MXO87935.1 DUF1499 domain-containing protein [Alteraurantiacibacter aestuarii]